MIKVKNNYHNHREYWKSKEYLEKLFGRNVNIKSSTVQNFLNTIDGIPKSEKYTIAAYGSLLNISDIFRTMPTADNFRAGIIRGYTRIFNIGRLGQGCYLNIQPSDYTNKLTCNFIDISYEDLPEYILREGYYNIEILDPSDYIDSISGNVNNPVLTVVGDQSIINQSIGIEPQLNYVHLCLTGMKDVAGWEGVQEFLHDTLCYSNKTNDYIPLKHWLNSLDLAKYLVTNNYSSR